MVEKKKMDEKYKLNIEKEIPELLREFINRSYQSRLKMYTGQVVDNNDPDQLGRCKIRVFGVFDDDTIKAEDIPWASPEQKFVGSTVGSFIVPPVDTLVRVYFDNDDLYAPVYTNKVINTSQIPADISEDYPDTMVLFETDLGEVFKINRKTLETEYRHSSGVIINMDTDGNIKIDSNVDTVESGKFTVSIKGDVSLTSEGDITVEASKGLIKFGSNATQPINNLPSCLVTGAPHSIGGQFPGTKGSSNVRP